jgi:polysaccharide pyruvyl transferase WcaK-like protein
MSERAILLAGGAGHANVFAAAVGVPSVALAYDPKVSEFMRQLGCAVQALDLGDLRPAQVAERVVAVLDGRQQAIGRLREQVQAMVESARECAAAAVRLANQAPVPGALALKSAERRDPAGGP